MRARRALKNLPEMRSFLEFHIKTSVSGAGRLGRLKKVEKPMAGARALTL